MLASVDRGFSGTGTSSVCILTSSLRGVNRGDAGKFSFNCFLLAAVKTETNQMLPSRNQQYSSTSILVKYLLMSADTQQNKAQKGTNCLTIFNWKAVTQSMCETFLLGCKSDKDSLLAQSGRVQILLPGHRPESQLAGWPEMSRKANCVLRFIWRKLRSILVVTNLLIHENLVDESWCAVARLFYSTDSHKIAILPWSSEENPSAAILEVEAAQSVSVARPQYLLCTQKYFLVILFYWG